jgi:hypothetical protein
VAAFVSFLEDAEAGFLGEIFFSAIGFTPLHRFPVPSLRWAACRRADAPSVSWVTVSAVMSITRLPVTGVTNR